MPTVIPLWFGDNTDTSNACDIASNGTVVGIIMPQEWTPAPVTILVSADGAAYYEFYSGMSAAPISFNVKPGTIVPVNPDRLRCATSIKLRSGTADHPVVQPIAREFGIVVDKPPSAGSMLTG